MSTPYHRPHPWNWFLKRRGYVRFMVRELTAVFVGAYLVFLIVTLGRLGSGQSAFVAFLAEISHPLWRVLHGIVLVAALWHSITWFNLTPRAMPVFRGDVRISDPLVAIAMGYLPWIVVSILILWGVCP